MAWPPKAGGLVQMTRDIVRDLIMTWWHGWSWAVSIRGDDPGDRRPDHLRGDQMGRRIFTYITSLIDSLTNLGKL